MSIYKKFIRFNMAKAIMFLLLLFTVLLTILFFKVEDPQYSSLVSGLATGFALATIQFFFSWYEYNKIDKYERMMIKDIRPDRDKRELYESLITSAQKEILILAVTANRLINDFADETSNQPRSKVLLSALSRGVQIKILLPDKASLEPSSQVYFDEIQRKFQIIKGRHLNFEFKYFTHQPYHSIFLADDDCIIGPVFPGVSSRNTPSIYVESASPLASTYLEYFRNEWQKY